MTTLQAEEIGTQARYHVVSDWRSPASAYPRGSERAWSISSRLQKPGVYPMQEWGFFYYHERPLELTVLREGNKVWFTDEPRQVYALAEIGLFRARGHVVVGGLGLGLIQHFLRLNPQVLDVTTIERASELKTLVWPSVHGGSLRIGDFYEVLPQLARDGARVDTVITDFIFGHQSESTWAELEAQRAFCRKHYPGAQFLEHGWQRRMDAQLVREVLPPNLFGKMCDVIQIGH